MHSYVHKYIHTHQLKETSTEKCLMKLLKAMPYLNQIKLIHLFRELSRLHLVNWTCAILNAR